MAVMKTTNRIVAVVILFFTLSIPVGTEEADRYDRFQLWNDCEPMDLIVGGLDEDAMSVGLTKDAINTAAMRRLRTARLYDSDQAPFLFVQVTILRGAISKVFSIRLQYRKVVYDPATEIVMHGTTWQGGNLGTFGDADYILSGVSEGVDDFINEYLRVNQDSCSAK